MEPLFYTRISTAGWLFLGTILLSLWQGNPAASHALLQDLELVNPDMGSVIIGVLASISIPPVAGLLLERIASSVFWLTGDHMYKYASARRLGDLMVKDLGAIPGVRIDRSIDGATLHVLFYQNAHDNLINWTRRRTTHKYTSVTSILAIISGLIVAWGFLNAFSMLVFIVSVVMMIFLFFSACREGKQHREGIDSWAGTFGIQAIKNLKDELS